ncbi:hypothetical protein CYMTET_46348 [Cymbomonas tetramitiformis]|uniref:Uncharacterized protein n=1 Tax=Cymbomonas tetramitiformis TaxID=36881 RepID=A0AAE0EXD8_9CHLO|nr:hypothetical protein CYMTET_46348 [Cymbomonas tetramitiformis]
MADYLAGIYDGDDWQLNPYWFRWLDGLWGQHTVDRFATDKNALLPRFNSRWWCPGSENIDCFSLTDWWLENNWCNPPFGLVGRLLEVLRRFSAVATIIVPYWTGRHWWPILCPDGQHFAPFVRDWRELPRDTAEALFLPGGHLDSAFWRQVEVSPRDPLEQELLRSMKMDMVTTRAVGSGCNSYLGAFGRFSRWCAARQPPRECCPALPVTVALYLRFVMDRADTYSVVKTTSGAIHAVHDVALVPKDQNPTKTELCKAVREQARRKFGLGVKNRKAAMPVVLLATGIRMYHTDSKGRFSIIRLTVACMGSVMWAGCLRYSDMKMIWVGAMRFYPTHMVFLLTSRKNDQYCEGDVVYVARGGKHFCPVDLSERLIEAGQLALSGSVNLFQGWDGRKAVRDPQVPLNGMHMDYHACRREVIRMVAQAAGKTKAETMTVFGTQSMRSGGATVVAQKVSFAEFMRHGHWMTQAAAMRYIQPSTEQRVAVTAAADY